jgi:hypothetical protein
MYSFLSSSPGPGSFRRGKHSVRAQAGAPAALTSDSRRIFTTASDSGSSASLSLFHPPLLRSSSDSSVPASFLNSESISSGTASQPSIELQQLVSYVDVSDSKHVDCPAQDSDSEDRDLSHVTVCESHCNCDCEDKESQACSRYVVLTHCMYRNVPPFYLRLTLVSLSLSL